MKKKTAAFLSITVLAVAMLAGCGQKGSGETSAAPEEIGASEGNDTDTTAAVDDDEKDGIVCYVGHGFWDGSLDPVKGAYAYGYDLTNNALLCVAPDSSYTDDLAERWEVSDDALTYTFHLKDGIRFQDGSDFSAEDVVFTYKTVMENQGDNENVDLTKLDSVEAPDGSTVVFTLKEPYSPFLDTTARLGIVPSDGYDSTAFDEKPVGTGPWKIVQYDAEQQLIMEANEDYFDGAPKIKRVTFVDMDNEAAFSNAQSGQLDIVMVQPNYVSEKIEGMHIERLETMDVRNISLPCRPRQTMKDAEGNDVEIGNDVTADVNVRKALSMGINREQIIENAFNGVGKPAYGFTKNLEWGNAPGSEDGQVEEARRILEDAGWVDEDGDGIREKDGVKCAFEVYTPSDEQDRYNLAAAVAEEAKGLGISIVVKQTSWDEIYQTSNTGGVVWGFGQYDPIVIKQLFASEGILKGAFDNKPAYENAKVDSLISEAIQTPRHEEAVAKWKEAQAVYAEEYPYLYLVNIEHCYFVSDRLDISVDTQIPHPHGHGIPIICNMKDWSYK